MLQTSENSKTVFLAALLLTGFSIVSFPSPELQAQIRPQPGGNTTSAPPARKLPPATVTIEILTARQGLGLDAQQWQQTFSKIGVSVRIRRKVFDEKPQIKEEKRGTLRFVTVVGEIDRKGNLIFPGKSFRQSDGLLIKDWITELRTYGKQGSPEGKPLWGLNEEQFANVYKPLSAEVKTEVQGKTLTEALATMEMPAALPIRMSAKVAPWIKEEFPGRPPKVRQPVKGFSKGTALAILLNDFGLGMRPSRTPRGDLELIVDPLHVTLQVWPVGWKPKSNDHPSISKLYTLVPVELIEVNLGDVLQVISLKTDLPILVDYYRMEGRGIDFDSLAVSHPNKRTTWALVLRRVLSSKSLTRRVQIDERGAPFVWITPIEPLRPAQ